MPVNTSREGTDTPAIFQLSCHPFANVNNP